MKDYFTTPKLKATCKMALNVLGVLLIVGFSILGTIIFVLTLGAFKFDKAFTDYLDALDRVFDAIQTSMRL